MSPTSFTGSAEVGVPFAEVMGDPIAQSKSPLIHGRWLDQLGLEGKFLRSRVAADELGPFLERRRGDAGWRGCSVTLPHKQTIIPLLDRLDERARRIGAVNCVIPTADGLAGFNTDIDGVAAALDATDLKRRKAVVIGAGGGARALVAYLAERQVEPLVLLVRNPAKGEALRELASGSTVEILPLSQGDAAMEGAAAIANASPLGMHGAPGMPQVLLNAAERHARGATLFDMVYKPLDTDFLSAGRRGGGQPVDGLAMLIGQARRAFELFFGRPAPDADAGLRALLAR